MWNLLKVLNKDKSLRDLKNINEVYDKPADFVEEIIYHHTHKGSFENGKLKQDQNTKNNILSSSKASEDEKNTKRYEKVI